MHENDPSDTTEEQYRSRSTSNDTKTGGQRRSKSVEEVAEAYAEVADKLAKWRGLDRHFAGRYRRQQFCDAQGRVLDVACGVGRNFQYLSQASEVVGIDVSTDLLTHAAAELDESDIDGTVHQMDAQALTFPDDSFDTVISSFSTCTFPDPIAALQEMERVCRPDGQILLLEHNRSDAAPLAWLQDRRAESQYEKNGCRLDHEPLATVNTAGLSVQQSSKHVLGLVMTIDAIPR